MKRRPDASREGTLQVADFWRVACRDTGLNLNGGGGSSVFEACNVGLACRKEAVFSHCRDPSEDPATPFPSASGCQAKFMAATEGT